MAIVTELQLTNAGLDATTMEEVVNGSTTINGTGVVTSRLGTQVKTLAKVVDEVANGTDLDATVAVQMNGRLDTVENDFSNYNTLLDSLRDIVTFNIPIDAIGCWLFRQYSSAYKVVPNLFSTVATMAIITRFSRGVFKLGQGIGEGGAGGWLGEHLAGVTVTDNFDAGRDGQQVASRFENDGSSYLQYRSTHTLPAGTYTMVIDVKLNSGSGTFQMSQDGGTTLSAVFTPTGTMTQFKHEFTLASPASFSGKFIIPVAAASQDFCIDSAFLFDGPSTSVPSDPVWQGDMYLGNSYLSTVEDAATPGYLSFTNDVAGSIQPSKVMTGVGTTILAVVRRNTAYPGGVGERASFLRDPQPAGTFTSNYSLGEFDTEGRLKGSSGGRNLAATSDFELDLFDNDFHVISFTTGTDDQQLYVDGVQIASNYLPNVAKTVSCLQMGAVADFDVNAILAYDRKLTNNELQVATKGLRNNALRDSIVVNTPTNMLIASGDSIPASTGSYVKEYKDNSAQPVQIFNESIGGSMIQTNVLGYLNLSFRQDYELNSVPISEEERLARRFIVTVQVGANDLHNVGATAWLSQLWSLVARWKAAGFTVGVCTVLPRTGLATHNANRAVTNPAILAEVGGKIDFAIDFAGSSIGADGDENDTGKYGDGVHPTLASHQNVLAPIYKAAVDAWLL